MYLLCHPHNVHIGKLGRCSINPGLRFVDKWSPVLQMEQLVDVQDQGVT